ncbi:DUF421 domain-containing protein [Pisciglobus halotolerans]|uniref:Uncharacterized membrane protein YcaP, DUF421 family n=1 Tax=Pisciglobus halotolerans TaxID=745365 RepID=A0A1I3CY51_9LACT|nr:YetF domain-containing protein [Pisciglobus halotolerans]SFH79306.1 Uncharacterized membrane protein YcaP, DUF421 family [Pisciglobus halotolerans]
MKMLFSDWNTIFRILLVGTLAYLLLILVLRIFGKRTLSKLNAFDFVVTIALGSILATILTSRDLTLVDGTIAFTILIFLQFIITKLTIYFQIADKAVKASPTLLFYKGQYDFEAIKKERLSEEEILQAVRSKGSASMEDILAVVLETSGDLSIIQKRSKSSPESSTLKNINKDHFQ